MLQEPEVQEIAEGKVPLVFGSEVCLARFSVLALASAVSNMLQEREEGEISDVDATQDSGSEVCLASSLHGVPTAGGCATGCSLTRTRQSIRPTRSP